MQVTWVARSGYTWPDSTTPDQAKSIGPIWSSWHAWRACHSDNVVCDDIGQARALLQRAFQAVCNFYLPRRFYQQLERPSGVRWYDGEYQQQTECIEEIIAMHLASSQSDLVLLLGFDFATRETTGDAMADHRMRNQMGLMRQVIASASDTQWVALDHDAAFDPAFTALDNLSQDRLNIVFEQLSID